MKKTERLRKNEQFRKVFKFGKMFAGDKVVVYALRNTLPYSRVGITVSRKLGGAVERNQLKRILREAWQARRGRFKNNFDLVLVPRMKAKTSSSREIGDELQHLLVKGNIVEMLAENREKPCVIQKGKG